MGAAPLTWEEARNAWAAAKVNQINPGSTAFERLDIRIEGGGDVQIGDMTWDYDPPSIEIGYQRRGGRYCTVTVGMDFDELVRDIVAVSRGETIQPEV